MKLRLIVMLEHARADLLDAIGAIQRDDVAEAREKLEAVEQRFEAAAEELRAA